MEKRLEGTVCTRKTLIPSGCGSGSGVRVRVEVGVAAGVNEVEVVEEGVEVEVEVEGGVGRHYQRREGGVLRSTWAKRGYRRWG